MTPLQRDGSTYRYTLQRGPWLTGQWTVLFVMLNPSTADDQRDDPTIRRCMGFAKTWGFQMMLVGNLYALRATDPHELHTAEDPIGPENDRWLARLVWEATETVVAWGATPRPRPERAQHVLDWLEAHGGPITCLGRTKDGSPRHPLYVRRDAVRETFKPERIAA